MSDVKLDFDRKESRISDFIKLLEHTYFQSTYWVIKIEFFLTWKDLVSFVKTHEDVLYLIVINEKYNCISYLKNYTDRSIPDNILCNEIKKENSRLIIRNDKLLDLCQKEECSKNRMYLEFRHESDNGYFYPKEEYLYCNQSAFYSCIRFLLKVY